MELWQYERQALDQGHPLVCGCDEAGAGPLAGPVYAAAVVLPVGEDIPGLNDSKKLTEKKREALFPVIQERAVAWAVARVEAEEIDRTDILSARMKAMQLAIDGLGQEGVIRPHRRQPGQGAQLRYYHAPRLCCKGRFPVGVHRRGLGAGQGEPGPLHAGAGPGVPRVPV